jgi:hypothetical protein
VFLESCASNLPYKGFKRRKPHLPLDFAVRLLKTGLGGSAKHKKIWLIGRKLDQQHAELLARQQLLTIN